MALICFMINKCDNLSALSLYYTLGHVLYFNVQLYTLSSNLMAVHLYSLILMASEAKKLKSGHV